MLLIVHLFEFDRWYVAKRSQEPLLVEPAHPVESGELDIVDSLPRAVLSNDLGLEVGERFGCSATDSVHQQAVRGDCMRRRPVDPTHRSLAAF